MQMKNERSLKAWKACKQKDSDLQIHYQSVYHGRLFSSQNAFEAQGVSKEKFTIRARPTYFATLATIEIYQAGGKD